jgi:inosine-uridine nucleoside N-ribohydrolase
VTLIGLGPAANIPRLVEIYQPKNIKSIVLMGGAFFDNGNITEAAEFNTFCDPVALRHTMALGIPTTLVPLDVCQKVQLSRATVQSYLQPTSSLLTQLIVQSHMSYMDFYTRDEGFDGCFPHDSVAMMAAAHPEWFYSVPAAVTVDLHDELRGRTRLAVAPHSNIQVVTGGKLKFVREFLNHLGNALARWPAAR